MLDGLVVRGRWMPSAAESAHNVARTLAQWRAGLSGTSLRIVRIVPTACFLSDPIDAGSHIAFAAHRLGWRALTAAIRDRNRLAGVIVPPLAALDRAITSRLRAGPSTKLLVLERVDCERLRPPLQTRA